MLALQSLVAKHAPKYMSHDKECWRMGGEKLNCSCHHRHNHTSHRWALVGLTLNDFLKASHCYLRIRNDATWIPLLLWGLLMFTSWCCFKHWWDLPPVFSKGWACSAAFSWAECLTPNVENTSGCYVLIQISLKLPRGFRGCTQRHTRKDVSSENPVIVIKQSCQC